MWLISLYVQYKDKALFAKCDVDEAQPVAAKVRYLLMHHRVALIDMLAV